MKNSKSREVKQGWPKFGLQGWQGLNGGLQGLYGGLQGINGGLQGCSQGSKFGKQPQFGRWLNCGQENLGQGVKLVNGLKFV